VEAFVPVATFLYRLGRLAFRRRWYVVLVWAAVLGAVDVASATAFQRLRRSACCRGGCGHEYGHRDHERL
jgi:hypothetical protein